MLYGNCRVPNIQSSQPEHMLWRHNCEVHIRETEGKLLSKELLLDVKEQDNLHTQQCFRELLLEDLPHKTRNSIPCITVGRTIKTQNEEITAEWKSTETKESSCQKSCSLMSRETANLPHYKGCQRTDVQHKDSSWQKSCSFMSKRTTSYAHYNAFRSSCRKSYRTRRVCP